MKQCSNCGHYNALKGEPPAGWCEFMANENVPFWMQNYRTHIDSLGADVVATDGAECEAFKAALSSTHSTENQNG